MIKSQLTSIHTVRAKGRYNSAAILWMGIAILAAHAAADANYSWREHTISALGAQGYENAWIMRTGFVGFGTLVILGAAQRARAQRAAWSRELPLMLYGACILISGFYSTEPFMPGVAFSETEAGVHSFVATLAGAALSLGILLYLLSESTARNRIVHVLALVLLVAVSALFGLATGGAGIAQRILYAVGFAWLIYIETSPSGSRPRLS